MTLLYETLAGEDFELGIGTTTKTNPQGGTLPSTQVSLSTLSINGAPSQATVTAWTPGAIAAGQSVSTTVNIQGALTKDMVLASYDQMGANNLELGAFVQSPGVVRVTLSNPTSLSITPTAGNIYLLVFHFR